MHFGDRRIDGQQMDSIDALRALSLSRAVS